MSSNSESSAEGIFPTAHSFVFNVRAATLKLRRSATPFSLVVVFDSFPHFFYTDCHRTMVIRIWSVLRQRALLVVKSVFKNRETKNSGEKEQRRGAVTDDEASFACERVCVGSIVETTQGLAKVRRKNER